VVHKAKIRLSQAVRRHGFNFNPFAFASSPNRVGLSRRRSGPTRSGNAGGVYNALGRERAIQTNGFRTSALIFFFRAR